VKKFRSYVLSPTKYRIPEILLLAVSLIWGIGFSATNNALSLGAAPSLILTLRMLIPALFFGLFFRRQIKIVSMRAVCFGIKAGFFLFFGFMMQTIGMKYTTPANSAFITSSNVIMVPFLSWLIIKRRPKIRELLLSAVCFLGISILSSKDSALFGLGDTLTLFCALGFAAHIAFLGTAQNYELGAGALVFFQLLTAGVLSFFVFMFFDSQSFSFPLLKSAAPDIIFLALLPTGLCFFLQSWAQRRISASKAAVILSCEGLFGCIFSVINGFDHLSVDLLLGGSIILISVILIQKTPKPAVSNIS
jgi:drug/metabolite transporter (DMT)-like permease